MDMIFIFFMVLIGSALLTGWLKNYAIRNYVLDVPNERSLHNSPTPRGGGLAIIIFIFFAIAYSFYVKSITLNVVLALAGGVIVAATGLLDDHKNLSAKFRIIIYTIASIIALFFTNSEYNLYEEFDSIYIKTAFYIITTISIVWLINLFNFMDGADGFAAIQAICASLFSGFLFWDANQETMALVSMCIFCSTCGFLYWNWPPAKIFMGDVGSCTLGFLFGVMAIIGYATNSISFFVWFILLSIFICDSTFTLLMRIAKKEKWYKAHKSHAYQKIVLSGVSHKTLGLFSLGVNILVLWPIAWIIYKEPWLELYVLVFVIFALLVLWSLIQFVFFNKKYN
jgi:Fuc2NAc and GlcNAc transferase